MQTEVDKEILRLKIRLEILEQYLATANKLPILGPGTLREYRDNVDEALEKAGL